MREQMKEYIKTTDLIKTFTDMASRGSLLGKASQQDHLMQIIGAICNEAFKEDSDTNESFAGMSYPVYKVYGVKYPVIDSLQEVTFKIGCMRNYDNKIALVDMDSGYIYKSVYSSMKNIVDVFKNVNNLQNILVGDVIINRVELLTHIESVGD